MRRSRYFFGVSDTTAGRAIKRVLPLLEQAGKDTMRLPDPGRKHRQSAQQMLTQTPALALPPELDVVVDSFEQRVQRPQTRADADTYYSGKKKMHTLKSQVAARWPDRGDRGCRRECAWSDGRPHAAQGVGAAGTAAARLQCRGRPGLSGPRGPGRTGPHSPPQAPRHTPSS